MQFNRNTSGWFVYTIGGFFRVRAGGISNFHSVCMYLLKDHRTERLCKYFHSTFPPLGGGANRMPRGKPPGASLPLFMIVLWNYSKVYNKVVSSLIKEQWARNGMKNSPAIKVFFPPSDVRNNSFRFAYLNFTGSGVRFNRGKGSGSFFTLSRPWRKCNFLGFRSWKRHLPCPWNMKHLKKSKEIPFRKSCGQFVK